MLDARASSRMNRRRTPTLLRCAGRTASLVHARVVAKPLTYYAKHRRWYCKDCRGQFTAKVGTVFEDSPIGFAKWLPAMWLIASNRNGISSYEIARGVKVTQKTAWFTLHRVREAMSDDKVEPFSGAVGADEAYIGAGAQYVAFASQARQQHLGIRWQDDRVRMVERKGKDKLGKCGPSSSRTIRARR
jgi:transposase-like protein